MPQASFLPEDYIAQRAERRSSLISLTLFVVVMTAVVGAFFVTNRQWAMVKMEQREINAQYTEAARRIEELQELEGQKAQLLARAEVAAALVERVPRSILLAELTNRMPDAVSLEEFDLKSEREKAPKKASTEEGAVKSIAGKSSSSDAKGGKGAKKPGAAPTKAEAAAAENKVEVPVYRVTIAMVGEAPSDGEVAEYLKNLGDCPLLRDVELKYSKEVDVDGQLLRTFRIEAVLDPRADAKMFEPLKMRREPRNPMDATLEFESFDPVLIQIEMDGEGSEEGGR